MNVLSRKSVNKLFTYNKYEDEKQAERYMKRNR